MDQLGKDIKELLFPITPYKVHFIQIRITNSGVALHKGCSAAALQEILRKVKLNVWNEVFISRYTHSLKECEWNRFKFKYLPRTLKRAGCALPRRCTLGQRSRVDWREDRGSVVAGRAAGIPGQRRFKGLPISLPFVTFHTQKFL